ncbi:GNAT family N-acetyltransferase [Cupriavidus sp. USMAA2-4]|uniref:GNAT family N-acetyltransferase n=1 Tax=Cupriavidus malaysiensis TaxID=367825 RepID=A0ABN4TXY2_9BURK|nr:MULTISPECIES: GNAT family N-acetyltransferase [Cupriavidus]AOY94941.1 GNAT family N-acetyltransferase [Cupriavidus sp. USMAA2-4]AOZ10440.1 GNAT family N-acetyltransferase [Cupriavidus malaysiensis]
MPIDISTDRDRLDIPMIHDFLSNRSTWARGIDLDTVQRSIRHALCFGAYDTATGRQVGFARVITDQATFAYLVDVFVLETHRGQGVSRRLMEAVMACPALARLRRFTLVTSTAAGLYARFGFTPLHAPQAHMEILRPDVYRQG